MTVSAIFATSPDDNMARISDLELFLRPVIRLLVLFRVSMPAFIALVKKLYLEEARKKLEQDDKTVTVPQLAYEAGCTDIPLVSDFLKGRRTTLAEIGNLAETGYGKFSSAPFISLEATVCERWRTDPLYLHKGGDPMVLPVRGKGGRSFDGLVRRCVSGRMSYGPLLQVLTEAGLVVYDEEKDTVSLTTDAKAKQSRNKKRSGVGLLPKNTQPLRGEIHGKEVVLNRVSALSPESALSSVCRSLAHLATTCVDNIQIRIQENFEVSPFGRMQAEFYSDSVPIERYWEFKSFTTQKLNQAISEWIADTEEDFETHPASSPVPAGFGVYFFDLRDGPFDIDGIGVPQIL